MTIDELRRAWLATVYALGTHLENCEDCGYASLRLLLSRCLAGLRLRAEHAASWEAYAGVDAEAVSA